MRTWKSSSEQSGSRWTGPQIKISKALKLDRLVFCLSKWKSLKLSLLDWWWWLLRWRSMVVGLIWAQIGGVWPWVFTLQPRVDGEDVFLAMGLREDEQESCGDLGMGLCWIFWVFFFFFFFCFCFPRKFLGLGLLEISLFTEFMGLICCRIRCWLC